MFAAALALTVLAVGADPKPPAKDWAEFADARRGKCVGAAGSIATPIEFEVGARKYRIEGHRLIELGDDKDKGLRIGLLRATKDDRAETLAAIATMLERFEKRKVDVIVANGDLATDEFEMENLFPALAKAKVLVVATIGNTESCGSFNKIADDVFAKNRNF